MNKRKNLCDIIAQICQVSNYNSNGHDLDHDILC